MSSRPLREAIAALYAQVAAPEWAAANLDALADVLRDLSWLPAGTVVLTLPDLAAVPSRERAALQGVLQRIADQTSSSPRPVRLEVAPPPP